MHVGRAKQECGPGRQMHMLLRKTERLDREWWRARLPRHRQNRRLLSARWALSRHGWP
jgi:hypothetical protein